MTACKSFYQWNWRFRAQISAFISWQLIRAEELTESFGCWVMERKNKRRCAPCGETQKWIKCIYTHLTILIMYHYVQPLRHMNMNAYLCTHRATLFPCMCELQCSLGMVNAAQHTHTHTQARRHTCFFLRCAHVCMCVPFIMLELRSAGSYSTCQDWSPSPSQLLCFGPWRIQHLSWIFTGRGKKSKKKKKKKSCMSTIYTGQP